MEIKNKLLSEIAPYPKNAKKHDEKQINNVAESIKKYGFVQPVVIDKDGVIVIGHCRALAAKKLGMTTVPCVCVEDLTPEQVNALRIVDNKTNESEWDFDLLSEEIEGINLDDFDFEWGIESVEDKTMKERDEVDLKEEFSVIIDCKNEEECECVYNKLTGEGYICRVSTL